MPRKRKRSDTTYNARRRFIREAERYAGKAESSKGATASRYRELARQAMQKAAKTYKDKASALKSSVFTRVAERIASDAETLLPLRATPPDEVSTLVQSSYQALEGNIQDRRDREARAILSTQAGSRIMAGLVNIWQDAPDAQSREQAITSYFGVESMMDVIEILEKNFDLYSNPESQEKYHMVSLAISANAGQFALQGR